MTEIRRYGIMASCGQGAGVLYSEYAKLEQAYRDLSRERLAYGRTERNKALAEAALLIRSNKAAIGMYTEWSFDNLATVFVEQIEGLIEP